MGGLRGVDDTVHKRLVDLGNGVLVEEDVNNVVEKIRNYDPNLIVQYLDPARATDLTDAPYRIMELCPDGLTRPVMQVWELDDRVIERIHDLDKHRVDILAQLDATNAKARQAEQRRYKQEIEAVSEMVRGVLRSPKDTYTAKNPVTGEDHKFTNLKQSP